MTYVRLWKHLISSKMYIKKESLRCVFNNAVLRHQATKNLWVATRTHGLAVLISQLDENEFLVDSTTFHTQQEEFYSTFSSLTGPNCVVQILFWQGLEEGLLESFGSSSDLRC